MNVAIKTEQQTHNLIQRLLQRLHCTDDKWTQLILYIWDLRCSQQWKFRQQSSGLTPCKRCGRTPISGGPCCLHLHGEVNGAGRGGRSIQGGEVHVGQQEEKKDSNSSKTLPIHMSLDNT